MQEKTELSKILKYENTGEAIIVRIGDNHNAIP
jgi:hypothetical protein